MDYTQIAIMAVVIMTGVGVVFGFVLALADKKFAMEENPLIGEVEEALPKGQCGACGFPGCAKYAEAVVLDPDVPPNKCVPGKAEVAAIVAQLTGKVAETTEPKYAHVCFYCFSVISSCFTFYEGDSVGRAMGQAIA